MSEEQTSEQTPVPVTQSPAVFTWGGLFFIIVAAIIVASLVLGVVGAIVWAVAIDKAEEELGAQPGDFATDEDYQRIEDTISDPVKEAEYREWSDQELGGHYEAGTGGELEWVPAE